MLTEIDIKQGYSTSVNDIGEEFYVPTLQNAISYKRIAGYFSSTSFLYFAKGIEGLLKNNGKYFLIVSEQISKEDYESMGWEADFCLEVGNGVDDRLQLRGSLYYGNFKLIKVAKGEEYFNGALNG